MKPKVLYGLSKNGKVKVWKAWYEKADNGFIVVVEHGYHKGEQQQTRRLFKSGKNLGKANETTPKEQAAIYLNSIHSKKLDTGYVPDVSFLHSIKERPMLAQSYDKHSKKVQFPAYAQPKLNGVRCFAVCEEDGIKFYSRNGKQFVALLKHKKLIAALEKVMKVGDKFDGELYIHATPFEKIVSYVKNEKDTSDVGKLEYWVFDIPTTGLDMTKRVQQLKAFSFELPVRIVPTELVDNHDSIKTKHDAYVAEGYEGIMIRNRSGVYEMNYRSYDLLKWKYFKEEEFKVIGATTDNDGGVMWICISPYAKRTDNVFHVRPIGQISHRIRQWHDWKKYMGKMLTVKYQYLSEAKLTYGLPIFPVGIGFRDYE